MKYVKSILLVFVFFVSLCSATQLIAKEGDSTLRKVRLQLKWKHQFQFAGYYAAIEKGFYKNAGLEVTLIEAVENQSSESAVFNHQAEFGVCTSDIVLMRSNGLSAVVLACIFQHSPQIIIGSKKSGIENVHDLIGKSVMLEPHAADMITYLNDEGVSLDKMKIRTHQFDTNQLILGEVDAITAYNTDEPHVLQQAKFDYTVISPNAGGIDFYGDILFTSQQLIETEPELVERFVAASLRGWKYAMEHQPELVDIIYNTYSKRHSKEHLRFEANQMTRYILPEVVEIGYANRGRWANIIETYFKTGIIKNRISIGGMFYADYQKAKIAIPWKLIFAFSCTLLIISFVTFFFYNLSRKLRNEITQRERIEKVLIENEKYLLDLNIAINQEVAIHKKTSEALRISNENFKNIFNTAPFPIAVTKIENAYILHANTKVIDLYEIPPDKITDYQASDFFFDVAEIEILRQMLLEKEQIDEYEIKVKSLSGKIYWVVFSARKLYYNGELALLNSQYNITERKQTEEALQRSENELRILNATKDKFFSIIAHDLKSPFNALLGFSKLLVNHVDTYNRETIRQYVENIFMVSNQTYKLLENLLEWSRLQQGLIIFKPEINNLKTIVYDVFLLSEQMAINKGISLQNLIETDIQVVCEIEMTKTTLRNIIFNAIKYTKTKGLITIDTEDDINFVKVKITDNGVGISESKITKLFNVGENISTKGTNTETGTGLGLILCKELIEKQGGTISVISKINIGSEFTFTLPKPT